MLRCCLLAFDGILCFFLIVIFFFITNLKTCLLFNFAANFSFSHCVLQSCFSLYVTFLRCKTSVNRSAAFSRTLSSYKPSPLRPVPHILPIKILHRLLPIIHFHERLRNIFVSFKWFALMFKSSLISSEASILEKGEKNKRLKGWLRLVR